MFLAPDGDEVEIANAAAEFLAEAMPIDRLRREDAADLGADLRRSLGEMGWFGLAVAEARGGSGLTAVEHALFFREAGRQCGPVDLIAQCLAATITGEDLRARIMSGGTGVALAVRDGETLRLLGAPDAAYALEVSPKTARLHAIEPGSGEPRPALDPAGTMRVLRDVAAPVLEVSDAQVWQLGQLAASAMLIGVAEAALDQIVEYAKIRETFGRKIGSYQAVRHPCADMALRAETARCQLWFAAAAIKEGRGDAPVHLDAAKHLANQAAIANCDSNIQLHGGIGVTEEHNAHLLLKHAMVLAKLFGSKRTLLAQLLHAEAEA